MLQCCCNVASARSEVTCCYQNKVKVHSDGTCIWYDEYRLSVSHCEIDITWFPFDSQVCDLVYESRNYDSSELNVTIMSPAVELDSYSRNGEWELLGKTQRRHHVTII